MLSHLFFASEQAVRSSFFRIHGSGALPEDSSIIKVCTWNTHRFMDRNNDYRLHDAMEYLKLHQFDIICLQEVINKCPSTSPLENDTIYLADSLGYHYYCKYGLAILSKTELWNADARHRQFHYFSYGNYCIQVTTTINGQEVVIQNYHLNCDIFGYEQYRCLSDQTFHELGDSVDQVAHVVCGDFNTTLYFDGTRKIKNILGYPKDFKPRLRKPTFPTFWPLFKLDRIYTNERRFQGIKYENSYVDYTNKISDHYPLIAELRLSFI
jgi:endonuclease/exonuclease/phosphatase family metal-dependent hydrolase